MTLEVARLRQFICSRCGRFGCLDLICHGASMSNHSLLDAVLREVERQDSIHREGYPATRDGVRLGIATIQDELDEALNEWRNERRMPRWTDTRGELIQVVGVGLRLLRSLYAHEVEVSRENAARQAEYNASGKGAWMS